MSDTPGNGQGHQGQAPLIVNGQYIKDLSFESPNSPGILAELQGKHPEININVNVKSGKIEGQPAHNLYEVVLEIRSEMKLDGKVGFIAELQYAGVFTLNVPEEHLSAFLLIECPRLLFPFARAILADVTRDGGFVPLLLQPIDFVGLYQQSVQNDLSKVDAEVAGMVGDKADA